jgi:hypothetical protein
MGKNTPTFNDHTKYSRQGVTQPVFDMHTARWSFVAAADSQVPDCPQEITNQGQCRTSAFKECRNFEMSVRKIEQLRRSACGLADAQFFSRLRHR